jgi:hypothetical protein
MAPSMADSAKIDCAFSAFFPEGIVCYTTGEWMINNWNALKG